MGHISRNCRRTSNTDGRNDKDFGDKNYGRNFPRKRKFSSHPVIQENLLKNIEDEIDVEELTSDQFLSQEKLISRAELSSK